MLCSRSPCRAHTVDDLLVGVNCFPIWDRCFKGFLGRPPDSAHSYHDHLYAKGPRVVKAQEVWRGLSRTEQQRYLGVLARTQLGKFSLCTLLDGRPRHTQARTFLVTEDDFFVTATRHFDGRVHIRVWAPKTLLGQDQNMTRSWLLGGAENVTANIEWV